ncbi:MAG TPA: hypothetical protein VFS20_01485, partial [Longimicrobium sp.]|nr:hypothetical protein [Longimicrobium sp.]
VHITGASLEHGVALGSTVHYVDKGIDTGAIIERRLLPVSPGDTNLADLELACFELAAEMMADTVEAIVRGAVPRGVPQPARFRLFRAVDAETMRRHMALAAARRAHELYEAWRPLCIDAERGLLPADAFEPPPTVTLEPVNAT